MGQYFNFGDNFGALLQEALNRNQKAQQFDEQQAMDYMRLQEAAKQWKQSFDMEKQYKTNDLKLKVLQDMDNRYVSEATAKSILGANHSLFRGGNRSLSSSYVDTLANVESSGNDEAVNPTTGATGRYQFLKSTFLPIAKDIGGDAVAGKSDDEIFALAKDKDFATRVFSEFTQRNLDTLSNAGVAITPGSGYLAHFLGAGGAKEVLSKSDDTPISSVVSANAIAANGPVFKDIKTVGDLKTWADDKMSGATMDMTSGGGGSTGSGLTSDQVSAPYSEILGGETPKLPNGIYYEKEAIANATAALRAAKLEAEIGKLTGGEGFDPSAVSRIPLETKSGTTEAYTNIARISGESTAFRSKAWTDKANSFQTGRDNADREMLLRDEIRKQFPEIPLNKYGRVEYDFDKKEYKLYQAMPATSYSAPDMEKIDEFVASEYPKMLSSLTKMSALDQQRSAPQIAQVGLLLKQMSLVSPKYQRIADPFLAVGSKYLQDVQNDQAKLDNKTEAKRQETDETSARQETNCRSSMATS